MCSFKAAHLRYNTQYICALFCRQLVACLVQVGQDIAWLAGMEEETDSLAGTALHPPIGSEIANLEVKMATKDLSFVLWYIDGEASKPASDSGSETASESFCMPVRLLSVHRQMAVQQKVQDIPRRELQCMPRDFKNSKSLQASMINQK